MKQGKKINALHFLILTVGVVGLALLFILVVQGS